MLNRLPLIDKNLHENKNEIWGYYTSDIEMIVTSKNVDQNGETQIRFNNNKGCETYINSIDQKYESEDSIFNGLKYKLITPEFNLGKRSKYGKRCDFKHKLIEFKGNFFFITTKG